MKKLLYLVMLVAALLCITLTASAASLITNTSTVTDDNGQFSIVVSLDEYTSFRWVRLCYEHPYNATFELVDVDVPYGVNYSLSGNDDIVLSAGSGSFSAGYLCTLNFRVTAGELYSYTDTYIWAGDAVDRYGNSISIMNSDLIWVYVNGLDNSSKGPVYGYTIDKISTRTGPGTQYTEGGTYNVKNQWIPVYAKAWDSRNGIWWVKVGLEYRGEERILWTGYKRFDHDTLWLDDLPTEVW